VHNQDKIISIRGCDTCHAWNNWKNRSILCNLSL